jgi:hypothetical protein
MANESCDHRPADWVDNSKATITQQNYTAILAKLDKSWAISIHQQAESIKKEALAYTARAPGLSR